MIRMKIIYLLISFCEHFDNNEDNFHFDNNVDNLPFNDEYNLPFNKNENKNEIDNLPLNKNFNNKVKNTKTLLQIHIPVFTTQPLLA